MLIVVLRSYVLVENVIRILYQLVIVRIVNQARTPATSLRSAHCPLGLVSLLLSQRRLNEILVTTRVLLLKAQTIRALVVLLLNVYQV